ncbi:cadherin-like domain-containing protein [Polaromonas sp. P1(28)-13]|nr:cadherin-like domain-containing protein [Polaromonas sp. P1(28)-13]
MEQSFTIDEVAGTQTFTFDPQFIDLKALTLPGGVQLDNIVLTTTAVILAAIAEDSGVRVITQAELLASASDVDNTHAQLSATGLAIATGSGTLADNGNGSWNYTPALNDDTAVSFSYTVTDGSLTAAGIATLDITPVNDAPTTTAVALAAIAEDSGVRVITQAELLANAIDIDSASLTASNLAIVAGLGSLLDNGDGSWSYTPALNDDSTVSFSYTVGDGSLTAAGSATLDIAAVNDAPLIATFAQEDVFDYENLTGGALNGILMAYGLVVVDGYRQNGSGFSLSPGDSLVASFGYNVPTSSTSFSWVDPTSSQR